ncbi:MAG TPA: acyl-CoA dehydrogenase [Actinomycetales bacterium]|nr:acyl-CoA dehydrogenase [Actinomycetales bacterium]
MDDATHAALPAHPDVDALRKHLDGRWRHVREVVRDKARNTRLPDPDAGSIEDYRAQITEALRELGAAGTPALGFSKEHGGGGDVGGSVVAFEMLGYSDLSLMVKAGVQWGLFGGAIQALGTQRHHEEYLPGIMSGELLGCFAMTESGHGSDVQALGTTLTYDRETRQIVVHTPTEEARKDYIGGAARDATHAVVFGQLITGPPDEKPEGRGVHAVLVRLRDDDGNPLPGITITDCGPKAGLNGVDNGRIVFDHVAVPREVLLDRYGQVGEDGTYFSPIESETRRFFTMLGALVRGRISVAGSAGSAAKKALAIAIRHGDKRTQFTRPDTGDEVIVLDYLAHQRRLLPALAKTYALHFAQGELVAAMHEVQSAAEVDDARQRELESRAAGIKAIATWHATETIQTCREACGGAGYIAENQLPQLKADTDVFTTFEGDNTVLLQLVAKGLLTEYREHFGDLDSLGMVRFVADQFVGTVIERTAARGLLSRLARVGAAKQGALLDRAWQVSLFEDREKHVVDAAARRLRRAASASPDRAFALFNAAQPHLIEAARVHVERVTLEAFVAGIDTCEDDASRRLLEKLCDLYVLSEIEEHRGWFLEHGRLTPAQSKAVTNAVDELCGQLRPFAVHLVEAFGIPPEWLTAPIAKV